MLEQEDVSPSQSGFASVAQQRESAHLYDTASSPPSPQIPHPLVMTEISSSATITQEVEKQSKIYQGSEKEKEQERERNPQPVEKEAEPGGSGKEVEPGGGRMEAEPERRGKEVEPERGKVEVELAESHPKREEMMDGGGVETASHIEVDQEAEKQKEEVEQEEEVEEAVDALELEEELQRPEDAMLDDLAKRIQVEEVRVKYKIKI